MARRTNYVPSLSYFLIRRISALPEELHAFASYRLFYEPQPDPTKEDILKAFMQDGELDASTWACIIQLYSGLPSHMKSYRIPLHDARLSRLLRIPSTPHFTLITILELPGCPIFQKDENILQLKPLHNLCALDAGCSLTSPRALKMLASTLQIDEDDGTRRGPWGLRILRLVECAYITKEIFESLSKFPLLCVLGMSFRSPLSNSILISVVYRCTRNSMQSRAYTRSFLEYRSATTLILTVPPHTPS
jgi:hypothetical protein